MSPDHPVAFNITSGYNETQSNKDILSTLTPAGYLLPPTIGLVVLTFALWSLKSFQMIQKPLKTRSLFRHAVNLAIRPFLAWGYLFWGSDMIQKEFEQSNGKPFELFAPDNRYVYVSNLDQIKEVDAAPDSVLSLQTASKQMLQPVYTMKGFNWFDLRGTEGFGLLRAVRIILTSKLPEVLPNLAVIIKDRFEELRLGHPVIKGSIQSPLFSMITELVVISNATSFFGQDLGANKLFTTSALQFVDETLICAEIVRVLPRPLAWLASTVIGWFLTAQTVVFDHVLTVAEQRCVERDQKQLGHEVPKHADCIQWVMEAAPRNIPWSGKRIVHELMALWFGSIHALSTTITFAIHDLCLHPEYLGPLRKEIQTGFAEFKRTGQGLPLLDSFLKESARLTPVESNIVATRRSALQPFNLADGTHVRVGDWICTPVKSIMQMPEYYPDPLQFQGFRFADPKAVESITAEPQIGPSSQAEPSKFADIGPTFHFWGTGRCACPGRMYAVSIMKLIIGQMLLNYDCAIVDKNAPRSFHWRSSTLPRRDIKVILTPLSSTC